MIIKTFACQEVEEEDGGGGGTLNSISQPSALPPLVDRQRECEGGIPMERKKRGI